MLGQYWGSLGQDIEKLKKLPLLGAPEWRNEKLVNHYADDYFCLYSDHPIVERGNTIICIMGSVTRDFERNCLVKDTEVYEAVLSSFKNNSSRLAQRYDGDFFFIIYEKDHKRLSLINNRYQCTNGYYSQVRTPQSKSFLFSAHLINIRHMREVLGLSANPHFGSIKSFISNGFTMSSQTQLDGVKKLLPCYRLQVDREQIPNLEHHTNEEFSFERKPFKNLDDKLDEYETLYQRGLSDYLEANKTEELGCLLSGGHDTSFAFIQGSKVFKKPLHAYTVTFPNWPWDEESFAKNICDKNNGTFHPIPFEAEDLNLVLSMVRGNQEPVVGSSLPLHKLSQEAATTVDTLLGGDGGDTLWGEYYPVAEYHRLVKDLPLSIRKAFHSSAKTLLKMTDWERFWELAHVAELFTKENFYEGFMRSLCTYRHFSLDVQDQLFSDEVKGSPMAPIENEIPFTKDNFSNSLIEGKLFNAFYTYQSFSTYRSVEHFGTKFYLPTINRDLMRFITTLPNQWVNGGTFLHRLSNNKTINRRFHKMALARHMKKEEIYNRSFDIPWYNILRPRTEVLNLLLKRLKNRGWYQEEYLDRMFKEFLDQKIKDYELLELKHHGYRIFTLLSLEVWATEFIDGRMSKDYDKHIDLESYLAN